MGFFTCQGLALGCSLAACQNHFHSSYPESLGCAVPDQSAAQRDERNLFTDYNLAGSQVPI